MSEQTEPQLPDDRDFDQIIKDSMGSGVRSKELEEHIIKDLKENPRYKEFFSQYNDSCVANFISRYASTKSFYVAHADTYERNVAEKAMGYLNQAQQCLIEIQGKKLFDAECLWRANQLKIDVIQHSMQFRTWHENLLDCPFLDPITAEEVAHYQTFLETRSERNKKWYLDSTDWEVVKMDLEDDDPNAIAWYRYHNKVTDSSNYLVLPDIRGEQELYYRRLVGAEERKKREEELAKNPPEPREPSKPLMNYHDVNFVKEFVKKFESRLLQAHYHNYLVFSHKADDGAGYTEELEEALRTLESISETIPIEAHENWQEAVCIALEKYENRKIAEALPTAFEDYLFKRENGIGYEVRQEGWWTKAIEHTGNEILRGRELAGEPRNFDF